jgi:hypothetical protein
VKFALAATALLAVATLSPALAFQAQAIEHSALMSDVQDVRHHGAAPRYHDYHDRCLHQSAGTSHHSCGTRTGGPVGGHH